MNEVLSLSKNDRDTMMRQVAREVAMDLYPLDQILTTCGITGKEFDQWKSHPQFLKYLSQYKDEWLGASNTHERTKIKAGIVMEEFMTEAYTTLHDKKLALNHRVELGKLVAKIAGMGEPKLNAAGMGGPGFSLTINIGQEPNNKITINPELSKVINHEPKKPGTGFDGFEDYDPFVSPSTLDDNGFSDNGDDE